MAMLITALDMLQTFVWFFFCYLPARLFRNLISVNEKSYIEKSEPMDRHCTNWEIARQILFSSVFCTLKKHALPTNDSGCYIRTLLPNRL